MRASSMGPVKAAFRISASVLASATLLWSAAAHATPYAQTNLVTDNQAVLTGLGYAPAAHVDTNLVNPWGVAHSAAGPFWVSDNGTDVSSIYDTAGNPQMLVVTVPPAPTGQVSTSIDPNMSDFQIGGAKSRF